MIKPVKSLYELRSLSYDSDSYRRLVQMASSNLGGPVSPVHKCMEWLEVNAMETSEEGVVDEVNFLIDMVNMHE